MKIKTIYDNYVNAVSNIQDLGLLFLRLILAYGFYQPAMMKVKDIGAIGDWFASMGYPAPYLNAFIATATEVTGIILLVLGLGIRIIAIPLQIVMLVAIATVHWTNGFAAGDNGFEIPLYYLLMLFVLMAFGAGKYSIDALIRKSRK